MAKLVSATYGEALFELAVSEGKEDELLEEIRFLREVFAENPDFGKMMNHPKILKEDKLSVLQNVFKDRISDNLLGFLHLIIVKGRYDAVDEILDYFEDQVKALKGIGIAYVTTAMELSDAQKKEVEARLFQTTKYRSMEMHYSVDESLIGGMLIRIGDRVVDSSIRTKLNKLQSELLKVRIG
ncbi:MAG: F0F1 ATP synthase subunit delta [Lachnospiraceae bacterium]|nr:F0F1 ATP synthase subunit delta [Lachnospiraceae bacterium]